MIRNPKSGSRIEEVPALRPPGAQATAILISIPEFGDWSRFAICIPQICRRDVRYSVGPLAHLLCTRYNCFCRTRCDDSKLFWGPDWLSSSLWVSLRLLWFDARCPDVDQPFLAPSVILSLALRNGCLMWVSGFVAPPPPPLLNPHSPELGTRAASCYRSHGRKLLVLTCQP